MSVIREHVANAINFAKKKNITINRRRATLRFNSMLYLQKQIHAKAC